MRFTKAFINGSIYLLITLEGPAAMHIPVSLKKSLENYFRIMRSHKNSHNSCTALIAISFWLIDLYREHAGSAERELEEINVRAAPLSLIISLKSCLT